MNILDFIENCPMRHRVKRLCAGAGSQPFNHWDSSIPSTTPPEDIILYVEWNIDDVTFKLFKYKSGFNAMMIPGSGSYMVFDADIRKEFKLVQYFDEDYNKLISYTVGEQL